MTVEDYLGELGKKGSSAYKDLDALVTDKTYNKISIYTVISLLLYIVGEETFNFTDEKKWQGLFNSGQGKGGNKSVDWGQICDEVYAEKQIGKTGKAKDFFGQVKQNLSKDSELSAVYDAVKKVVDSVNAVKKKGSGLPDVSEEATGVIGDEKDAKEEVTYNKGGWLKLLEELVKGVEEMQKKDISEIIKNGIENNKQVIFTGAPGTGKTYGVLKYVKDQVEESKEEKNKKEDDKEDKKEDRYKFVQFHPSYDYSDFVEGLRPVNIDGNTTFVRMDGIFKAFCRHIVGQKDKEKKYFFIVDEINRADLSKVFGELMFGLEESYRGIQNRFDTQYKNWPTYEISSDGKAKVMEFDCFKDGFFIPENLYFIGTMNDIDRSVESFDFALRRRFQWIDIKANEIMEESLGQILKITEDEKTTIVDLAKKIKNLNNKLTEESKFGLNEAYHIGPAYFKDFNGKNMEQIFEQKIEPIIREYLRGRKKEDVDDLVLACRKELRGEGNSGQDNNGK